MTERPWAGNKQRQADIAKQIMKRYFDDDLIDIAGACETILVNLVNNRALSCQAALEGIEAIAGDMKETIVRARSN